MCVTLGNICRSPIADAVFSKLIKDRGIEDQWKVDSAAIGGWHSGSPPDSRATATLKKHNVPYNGRARQVSIIYECLITEYFCIQSYFKLF